VKVVQLRTAINPAPRQSGDQTNPFEKIDSEDEPAELANAAQAEAAMPPAPVAAEAPVVIRKTVRKTRRWIKSPSPANVLSRALDGMRQPAVPFALLERALDRLPAVEPLPAPPRDPAVDRAAFWQVWLTHHDYLRALALRYCSGHVHDAEDALSEAMVKAAPNFSSSAIRNHRGWLVRLVHNACMDRHRSNRRQSRLAKDITDADAQSAPAVAIQPDRSPEELLSAFEQVGDLQRALHALPHFLAEPLLLYLDGRSDADIALSLNVTKEVVRKRRQIARALLRRQIAL
jgi:RNA polymerase sigma factor (sigma-70 family)